LLVARFPTLKRLDDRVFDAAHFDASGEQFGVVRDTVGSRRLGGDLHELGFGFKEVVCLFGQQVLGDPLRDLAGRDVAGVGDVVGPERNAFLPTGQTSGDKFAEMGDRVFGFEQSLVTHDLGQIVSRGILIVQGDWQTPDVGVVAAVKDFFAECFATEVPTAVVAAEAEVGSVVFSEPLPVIPAFGVNATGRNMPPGGAY